MATHSGKTVKLDIVTSDTGVIESIVNRLNSKESAVAFYRSITEHHAFYRCDSVRPAVKEQVARDFFDTFLSLFHGDEQIYIFDTERTCREAYDHARRTLYNFGSSAAADVVAHRKSLSRGMSCDDKDSIGEEVIKLKDELRLLKDSFHCPVCFDAVVDVVLQCGHLICSSCGQICEDCPFCRVDITSQTKVYLPVNLTQECATDPVEPSLLPVEDVCIME